MRKGGGEETTAKPLIDQVLSRWDLAVAHTGVFPVPLQVRYQTARELDFFQAPLIRTLIGLRGLPQRLVAAPTAAPRTVEEFAGFDRPGSPRSPSASGSMPAATAPRS